MATINNLTQGVLTVNSAGKVCVDFLYDGGWNQGEVAIFSLEGMENMEVSSTEFISEAASRALSNSSEGYVVIQDESDRARFSDIEDEINWENNFNGGIYQNPQLFKMDVGTNFAMMLVTDSTVQNLSQNTNDTEVLFSFGSINANAAISPQIADITGEGNTFGWEDVDTNLGGDKDFNDLVVQVLGAEAEADRIEDSVYANRNWLSTNLGQDLIQYANRPIFDSGTFRVNSTGQIQVDYLYDGGWFEGQLGVFSLSGMETYEPGSLEFIQEAANRSLSNSSFGRVLIGDEEQGAKFSGGVDWEKDFNTQDYLGIQKFAMNPGEELAFVLLQHGSLEDIAQNPENIDKWGKLPIFSVPTLNPDGAAPNQIVAVDDNGTLAFEDVRIDRGHSDLDYNDFVFQVQGLDGNNISTMDDTVNPYRDWRANDVGAALLDYADRPIFNEGVFTVGETGEVTFEYLYDGGWYEGELAIFCLEGMETFEPGSDAFIEEAARRAMSNSELGHILKSDRQHAARFSDKPDWENDFNKGEVGGIKTVQMNPSDQFGVMLVKHTTVWEITDASKIWQWGKLPLFSIPEANPDGNPEGQMVSIEDNGTYAFEDARVDLEYSDRDYNDVIFQIKGAEGVTQSINNFSNPQHDWRETPVGQELLEYSNRAFFDQGIFQVGETGEITVDYLYDGGWYEGEMGIFSLDGMDIYELGSDAFVEEAINRALSNNNNGHVIVQDDIEDAKYSELLTWENDFNQDNYLGKQTYTMTPGDTFGMVFIPGTTLEDALVAPDWAVRKQPLFSMNDANIEDKVQIGEINSTASGSVIGFEDIRLELGSNQDYNDAVIAIEGATAINLADIKDVIHGNRDWLDGTTGNSLSNYFS